MILRTKYCFLKLTGFDWVILFNYFERKVQGVHCNQKAVDFEISLLIDELNPIPNTLWGLSIGVLVIFNTRTQMATLTQLKCFKWTIQV